MELIKKYFTKLNIVQYQQLEELLPLYQYWNNQINVISRKDMENFYLHHVLHSLSLCRLINFSNETKVMDLGCGGGFPGIPLAIYYPEVEFTLIDSIGKKIKVVEEVKNALQLKNVRTFNIRAEQHREKYHYVVSRAVAKISDLLLWTSNSFTTKEINPLPNGLIAYKGGDLTEELQSLHKKHPFEVWDIFNSIPEEYFKNKSLVYVQK